MENMEISEFKKLNITEKISELLLHYKNGHDEAYLGKADIVKKELKQLEEDSLFLRKLEEFGVDNWDFFGDAAQAYQDELEEG